MKKLIFLLIQLSSINLSIIGQSDDGKKLEQYFNQLKDVKAYNVSKANDPYLSYLLLVKQALDHKDTSKGYFYQRVVLTHHGFNQPTVMQTQGYELYNGKNEIETILDANHINIEHRYFGESQPEKINWSYLNLEQATADLHHINQLFKPLYTNKWISTGISKGGQTTIFYKYFYPKDVDVAIPYVAPFTETLEDKRIYQFLDTIGTDECRSKIRAFQKYMLNNETAILEKLKWYCKGAGLTFDYLEQSIAKAYELSVLEYSFSFWQWGTPCEAIPVNQSLDSCLSHLLKVSNLDFFSDKSMENYGPHYYQAATEMGYYGYDIRPFKNEIKQFKSNPLATFPPKSAGKVNYDGTLKQKVNKWIDEQGNNIIYIYGGYDTWSANRINPSNKVNSKAFILPKMDHGGARIKNMGKRMKNEFIDTLTKWTNLKIDISKLD
jgi:hypothetical protein